MDQSLSSGRGHVSVLSCFPPSVGKDVVVAVVKPLRAGLGNPDTCSQLYTDRQVCVCVCVCETCMETSRCWYVISSVFKF